MSGVYEIVNTSNGNKYIGSTKIFSARFRCHRSFLKSRKHHASHLQRAWDKYGESVFNFKPIIICNKEDALQYEQKLIDSGRYIYNARLLARSGRVKGFKHTEEAKLKMSIARKGKAKSEEHKINISLGSKGKPKPLRSKEHAEKLAVFTRGKKQSPEHVAKRVAAIHIAREQKRITNQSLKLKDGE